MAGKTYIQWVGKGRFVGTDSSKHAIVLSTQDEENGVGVKPSDLLMLAVGACSSVDVVKILQKKRQSLTGLEVEISAEQDADPPWTFRKIWVTYIVHGHGLSEKAVGDAIKLAEDKYCSVKATLKEAVEFHTEYHIVEAE